MPCDTADALMADGRLHRQSMVTRVTCFDFWREELERGPTLRQAVRPSKPAQKVPRGDNIYFCDGDDPMNLHFGHEKGNRLGRKAHVQFTKTHSIYYKSDRLTYLIETIVLSAFSFRLQSDV